MRNPLHPPDLTSAIEEGFDASDGQPREARIQTIRTHVRNYLAEKFGVVYLTDGFKIFKELFQSITGEKK